MSWTVVGVRPSLFVFPESMQVLEEMDLKINERWVSVTTWINGKMGGQIKSAQNRGEERIAVSFFPFSFIVKDFFSASRGRKKMVGG